MSVPEVPDPTSALPRQGGASRPALSRPGVSRGEPPTPVLESGPPSPAGSHRPGAVTYEAAGELLRALAAPVRIAIVTELGTGPRCVHELVASTGAPQPLVSQHLRVLRGAGVVRGERRGREITYSLTDEHIAHIVADAISHAREPR